MYQLFEQKYKECEKSLFLVALGYLHNTEDAKDCVQEAVLSALKSFGSLKNQGYFKTWLTRIVINKSKDYLKRQRFTEEFTDNLNVFYDMSSDEIGIMDCICKLNPKSSIYITLRFYHDMTYEEVARSLKLPVSTVKYKTKKALNELKSFLEGDATKNETV